MKGRHALDVQFNINVNRPDHFWRTLGNCMTSKRGFYLHKDKSATWELFLPELLIIASYNGNTKTQETHCSNDKQFVDNLKLACVVYDKIEIFGKRQRLDNDFPKLITL